MFQNLPLGSCFRWILHFSMLKASVDLPRLFLGICYDTSYLFVFSSRSNHPTLDRLKFLVTTLSKQDKIVAFIRVDEDGALARYSEFMNTCHNMNIIVQTTGGDEYSLNGKGEIPITTLANITRALLLKSSHNK